jgi:hypothetical protein
MAMPNAIVGRSRSAADTPTLCRYQQVELEWSSQSVRNEENNHVQIPNRTLLLHISAYDYQLSFLAQTLETCELRTGHDS